MNKHQERAKYYHELGYNCAQAMICSYEEELQINQIELFRLVEGLGRGVAGLEKMCCVPIIMSMLVSYLETCDGDTLKPGSKYNSYACSKCLVMEFKEKVGTLQCKDILEKNRLCQNCCCSDIILTGIEILDKCLNE